jgi:hypothetical protein
MGRLSLLLLLTVLHLASQAQGTGDTTTIRVLDRHLVVTDPALGTRHTGCIVQLPGGTPPRRILLALTYACPDTMRCADWDYLDHVLVRPVAGRDTFEVARMLTPYGGQFNRGWAFTWVADVTDFAPVLRDSVEVIHVHTGYEPAHDRGWAVTMDLRYISGPPMAPVLAIAQLHRGQFVYGDTLRPLGTTIPPRTVHPVEGAAYMVVRSQQTGHGMDPADGCGEFCAKWRYVTLDGDTVQWRRLWRECASNPLYPQAGTWIFDRADWCPGELQPPDRIIVPLEGPSRPRTVGFHMEPYRPDSAQAFINLSAYTIQLGPATATHDAMITEVLVPSDEPRHARMNEEHDGPRVVIANAGSAPLRTLTFRYGIVGGQLHTYRWTGVLPFGVVDTVDLPGPILCTEPHHQFVVEVRHPNGQADEWAADNAAIIRFTAPPVLPADLTVHLRTNAEPHHNALHLTAPDGRAWIMHPLGTLKADTLYTHALHLPPGTYRLQLVDTAGDGLSFWYNSAGGHGHLRLLDGEGRLLLPFESDHGNGLVYTFRVGGTPTLPPHTAPVISLFPRRTQGHTRLDFLANEAGLLHVQVTNEAGEVVREFRTPEPVRMLELPMDITGAPPGRYLVTLSRDGKKIFEQRIRLEE